MSPGQAKCSQNRNDACAPLKPDFECTSEGVFPDPLNCKKFYNCIQDANAELFAEEYHCDNYYVFDPAAPNDMFCRLTFNRFCVVANCGGTIKNILLNYPFLAPSKGQIVASCRSNKKPLIFRCAEGFVAKLDTLPVECALICPRTDKVAFSCDESLYHECVFDGRQWLSEVKSCPQHSYFDAAQKQCLIKPTTTGGSSVSALTTLAMTTFGTSTSVSPTVELR